MRGSLSFAIADSSICIDDLDYSDYDSITLWTSLLLVKSSRLQKVSHYLGTPAGWRKKRLEIALALRQQGWTYSLIAEYLEVSPKSLMRDIKCYVIDPQGLRR